MNHARHSKPRGGRDDSEPLLRIENLRVTFETRVKRGAKVRQVHAVDGLSLDIVPGETLALVGESGCGKSSAGWALLRLFEAEGRVEYRGQDVLSARGEELRLLRRQLQIIFQDPYSSLNPRRKIGRSIREPLDAFGIGARDERDARVAEMLERVGLNRNDADRYPHEFSGGQRQRIGIARALAGDPSFIVCDEPTSALDVSTQAQILGLLEDLQAENGITYLLITHDLAVVRHSADRVAVMYLGDIVELATAEEIYSNPRHPYTMGLLQAAPIPDPSIEARRQHTIFAGEPPDPTRPPSGCRFRTRCPFASERCAAERPLLSEPDGHGAACHHWREIEAGKKGLA